jgi:hypothetical protein
MCPDTQMSLPGFRAAAAQRRARGTSPMIVTVSVSGPRVVSPPTSETLNSSAQVEEALGERREPRWSTPAA